jgi:hypothetical protein
LAAELQRALRRSEMLQLARDAMFASFEGTADKHLQMMFDRLDEDGSRSIDADELTHLSEGLRLNMRREEIEQAVEDIADNTGMVDYDQFLRWWNSNERGGPAGRLRSKLKLSGFLAKKKGSILTATELMDDDEGLAATEKYMQDILHSAFSKTHVVQGKSLGYFPPEHPVRVFANSFVTNPWVDQAIVLAIVVNMITMGFPPETTVGSYGVGFINLCIGFGFLGEMSMRIIQQGFVRGVTHEDGSYTNDSFLTNPWNVFDFVIISAWLIILTLSAIFGWDPRISNSVSVLRSIRCLRFFFHVRQMLSAIRRSTFVILDIGYIFIILFLIFGIALHTLLGGMLTHKCAAPSAGSQDGLEHVEHCPSFLMCGDGETCFAVQQKNMSLHSVQLDRASHIYKYGFDNAAASFMTLFSMTTLDDWHTYVNSYREVIIFPWWFVWAPIALFVIILGLCAVNVFLAGIAFSYITVRLNMKRFQDEQDAKDSVVLMLMADPEEVQPEVEADYGDPMCSACGGRAITYKCREIIKSKSFENGILITVVVNIVFMASETHAMPKETEELLLAADVVFTCIYVFEACVKIQGMGISKYFGSTMNRIDFTIVVSALISYASMMLSTVVDIKAIGAIKLIRIFRLLRVGRVAKLVLRNESVRFLLAKAFGSRAAIMSLIFLILFVIVVGALAGMQMFGQCFPDQLDAGGHLERPNFANFGNAFASTFIVFSTDSWTGMLFKFMECSPVAACAFFFTMIFTLYFVLSELFVAVFIENFDREDEDKRAQQITQYLESSSPKGMDVLDIKMKLDTGALPTSTHTI